MKISFGSKNFQAQPKDIIFPLIYIALLFVLGYFIWKLISPFLALALGGLIAYIHLLRDVITVGEE